MNLGGKLIVIEGPDHVGRSMHARLLSERLKAHGVAVSIVGLARSELLGKLIKSSNPGLHQLNWRTRALLYATDLHCLLYTSPSPRDGLLSRMPSSA